MQAPDGYTLKKALRSTAQSEVYLASRLSDGEDVILKAYRGDTKDGRAQRELEALRTSAGAGIPRALDLVLGSGAPALVLERVPGIPLIAWLESGPPPVSDFVEVAMQLCEGLGRVHAARLLHRDVTPDNVLVDPTTLRAHLLDFGRAQALGAQIRRFDLPTDADDLGGGLHYAAPEQTGRMNRGIDMRSDLYSFGAVLYFTATGRTPFEFSDPLALLHAHMARKPQPPAELRPELPNALSRLILKLLEKEPEDRYQSARAVLADLRSFREQLTQTGRIDDEFVLGTAQAPERPRFPRKLYGRTAEVALLRHLYAKACSGLPQILMLAGEPGAGKSALVDELRPELAHSSGYLAVGKFDLSRDRPYAAWTAALTAFVQQRLVDSDARLQVWREALAAGLGGIAQAAVDLVPDLQFVLRDVPPIPALGPRETQTRLALALLRFVTACATKEHPLVIFLDDLQWSDAASRNLLEDLLGNGGGAALLVVGAYRANEVHEGHPLANFFERLRGRGIEMESLTLGPLSREATTQMLAETLERNVDDVRPLADLVDRKTGTAPLFVRQFVDHLHGKDLLHYATGSGWSWDARQVAAAEIPESAVAIMMERLHRLEPDSRQVVELASCVGDEFDVDLLCQLSSRDRATLEQGLYALSDAGLIGPCPSGFRFVHDRIREAACALLPEAARSQLHYEIAQLLLARIPEAERGPRLLEIAEHLNYGIAHVREEQRVSALQLNLLAGKRALATGAASTSEAFFSAARALQRPEDWQSSAALLFDLLLQSAESAFLRRKFEESLSFTETLEARPLPDLQLAQVAAKRVQVFALLKTPDECTRYTLGVLRRFKLRLPQRPSRRRAVWALWFMKWKLHRQGLEAALRPAPAVDPRRLPALLVLGTAGASLVRTSVYLGALVSCRVVSANLRFGALARPSYSLGALSTNYQLVLHDSRTSAWMEEAATALLQRSPDPTHGPRHMMQIHAVSMPWRMRRRTALAPLDRIAQTLHEVGDVEYSYYARFLKSAFGALAGDPVAGALQAQRELADSIRRAGHRYPEPELFLRPYRLLAAPAGERPAFEEEIAHSNAEIATEEGSVEPYVRTAWLMVLCVHGRWDLAFAQSELCRQRVFEIIPYVHVADFTFYRGLAAAALARSAPRPLRRRYAGVLRESLLYIRRWAQTGPDFEHMALLLGGEAARLRGDERRALGLYGDAGRRAHQHEFPHHVALAHERRAHLLTAARRRAEAAGELVHAIHAYRKWGCENRAVELVREHRDLRADQVGPSGAVRPENT